MGQEKNRILIVDDDVSLCEILVNTLEYVGYNTRIANKGNEALACLTQYKPDAMLLDLRLPDMNGLQVLDKALQIEPSLQTIMISGQGTVQTAVKATKIGAFDFMEKPLDSERVLITIKNALEKNKLKRERNTLIENMKKHYIMIGQSQKMQDLCDMIMKASMSNSKVLIEGENGTGKELVARAIHHNSARAAEAFVAVNCAAIPESLIESELFGHKKGSFTGAISDKVGRFQLAEGGTLLLDEIGDMSILTQAKLLRSLEENTVERVGGDKPIPVDVRVIAATNQNLEKAIQTSDFREDLYFRLNVLKFTVPPLRDRREDIPLIAEYYIKYFCNEMNVPVKKINTRAMNRLIEYAWPGNVRELKNTIEKLVVLISADEIQSHDIASVLRSVPTGGNKNNHVSFREAKHNFEKEYITEKLYENNYNITKTAESMDLPRTYLHKKIKKLEIQT